MLRPVAKKKSEGYQVASYKYAIHILTFTYPNEGDNFLSLRNAIKKNFFFPY